MNNRKYKKIILFIYSTLLLLGMMACKSFDEEPPRTEHISSLNTYVMPNPVPINQEEREIVKQKNKEYKKALGITY